MALPPAHLDFARAMLNPLISIIVQYMFFSQSETSLESV